MRLNSFIKAQLRKQLFTYHTSLWKPPLKREMDFLDLTVKGLNNIRISHGSQTVSSRCKRIHLTPKVSFFRNPLTTISPTTTELSDLLLVVKYFENGSLKQFRAILGQIKFTSQKPKSWHIDTDQFFLMTQWPRFTIVSPARFRSTFHIKPKTSTWSSYGFIGPLATRFPIYHSAQRILKKKTLIPKTQSFSFNPRPPSGWDSSPSFMIKFLQGLIGENLLKNKSALALIRALYIIAKWKVDPPDELEWISDKDAESNGMGIIEFTVNTEKESEQEIT